METLEEKIVLVAEAAAKAAIEYCRENLVQKEYYTTEEAATYLCLSTQYLEISRCKGNGPNYIKLGRKAVKYKKADLDYWAESHRKNPKDEH
jgi:hypothetical protein